MSCSTFDAKLKAFDKRGVFSKIPKNDLLDFFHVMDPFVTNGELMKLIHKFENPGADKILDPEILTFLKKYKRRVDD